MKRLALFNSELCKFKTLRLGNIFSNLMPYDVHIVFCLAIITGLIWYFFEPIIFTYDSFGYLNSAKGLVGLGNEQFLYYRAPLLPSLLALTGVPLSQTFTYFIMAQFLLGVSTIMVMYMCLRRISRFWGLLGTLLFISTFVAFIHSKSIMTEEIYLFGWCLCIDGVVAYLLTESRLRLLEIVVSLLILSLSRAQGAFIIMLVLPFLAFQKPRKIPELIMTGLLFLFVLMGYSAFYSTKLVLSDSPKAITSEFGITHSTGKMIFMVVYWDPHRRYNWSLVHPENGPASTELFHELKEYYSDPAHLNASMDQKLFGRFAGHPNDLVHTIEHHPDENGQYWWAIWKALDTHLGPKKADKLLMNVTLETIKAHPLKVMIVYLRNFAIALITADSSYVWAHPSFGPDSVGEKLATEMKTSGDSEKHTRLAKFLNVYFPTIQLFLLLIVLIFSTLVWRSRWREIWLFCLGLGIYNHLTIAVAATPENRYVFYIFPLLLIIAVIYAAIIEERWKAFRGSIPIKPLRASTYVSTG